MAPWQGPRHRSWASDTNLSLVFAVTIIVGYVAWEIVGTAPQGLVTLVGIAGGALFGAVTGDKRKRDGDTRETAQNAEQAANRAEATANTAARAAASGDRRADVAEGRADQAEARESEPSLHRHDDEEGGPK